MSCDIASIIKYSAAFLEFRAADACGIFRRHGITAAAPLAQARRSGKGNCGKVEEISGISSRALKQKTLLAMSRSIIKYSAQL